MLGDLELLGAFRFPAAGQARPRRADALHHREPRVVSGREGGERRPLRPELALHERERPRRTRRSEDDRRLHRGDVHPRLPQGRGGVGRQAESQAAPRVRGEVALRPRHARLAPHHPPDQRSDSRCGPQDQSRALEVAGLDREPDPRVPAGDLRGERGREPLHVYGEPSEVQQNRSGLHELTRRPRDAIATNAVGRRPAAFHQSESPADRRASIGAIARTDRCCGRGDHARVEVRAIRPNEGMSVLRNRSRSQRQWTHRTAGLAAAAWLGLTACTSSPEALPTPKPQAVTVVTVAQRAVPVYGQYVGQTEAVKTVEIRARVEGFLERQVVPDGADVKAGDVLFVIDPRPFEATLRQTQANVARDTAQLHQTEAALIQREADMQQAQANLERDLAQLENARTQEGRYRTLLQKELIAHEQYDQIHTNMTALQATVQADRAAFENAKAALAVARAAIENARAVIRADEAAVDSAQIQLGYTTIRSPLDGRMGRAEVRVGSLVGRQDSTLLATLSTLDPMYVNFSVSEREALSVWRYRTATPAPTGPSGITMTLPDDSAYPHDGRLDFVDRAVDPRTGTLALRATFANPRRLLQPGQYMRLRILLDE